MIRRLLNPNFIRIASNYARLLLTFIIGLAIIRMMSEISPSALVLYLLVAMGTGVAYFFKAIIREAVIPVIGLSYDSKLGRKFGEVYWIAVMSSAWAGLLSLFIFGGLYLARGYLNVGELGQSAVLAAFLSAAIQTFFSTTSTPFLNGILVSGRITTYNALLVMERVAELIAVVYAIWFMDGAGIDERVVAFYVISCVLYCVVQIASYFIALRIDPKFGVKPQSVRREDINWVGKLFGWNAAVVLGFMLYLRLSTFAANAAFGEVATLTLGIVFTVISYQRQISMGLVIGLDAAISRIFARNDGDSVKDAKKLLELSTLIQSAFTFLSMGMLWVFIEPLLRLWFGDSLDGAGWDVQSTAILFKIMALGVVARSISESWMKYLSGKGEVKAYAKPLFAGSILNALIVIWACISLAENAAYIAIAVSFSVLHMIVHLLFVGRQVAQSAGLAPSSMFKTIVISALPALIGLGLGEIINGNEILKMGIPALVMVAGYCGLFLMRMRRIV